MSGLILIQSFTIAIVDIVQFDELLKHAQFHAEEHGDNLFVFFSKHYGELKEQHDKEHREEKKDHEKLPFQNQYNGIATMAIVSDKAIVPLTSYHNPNDMGPNFYYHVLIPSLYSKVLFQPPKFA